MVNHEDEAVTKQKQETAILLFMNFVLHHLQQEKSCVYCVVHKVSKIFQNLCLTTLLFHSLSIQEVHCKSTGTCKIIRLKHMLVVKIKHDAQYTQVQITYTEVMQQQMKAYSTFRLQ